MVSHNAAFQHACGTGMLKISRGPAGTCVEANNNNNNAVEMSNGVSKAKKARASRK